MRKREMRGTSLECVQMRRYCAAMPSQPVGFVEFVNAMFDEEPAGSFADGYIFRSGLDLKSILRDPANGYWHCDVADHDSLTWSDRVHELFGLPAGSPVDREWAVARYTDRSREALERVRKFGLTREFGFVLDAEIEPENEGPRWIRVLAVPIVRGDRIVALHGAKKAI